jgi:inorganic phosphate transporter, PiT family
LFTAYSFVIQVAGGIFNDNTKLSLLDFRTAWIIVSCQAAIAFGTEMGGWRIIKTMGMKLSKLKPVHGFYAEAAGVLTIFLATRFGIPVSTTHTIAGAIVGVSSTTHASRIRWGLANCIALLDSLFLPSHN